MSQYMVDLQRIFCWKVLEGLQRAVTYNISILAVSQVRLPSPLVGPITVIPGISGTAIYCFLYNLRGNRGHFVVK